MLNATIFRDKVPSLAKGLEGILKTSSGKTEELILSLLEQKPNMTVHELSDYLKITERAVHMQIARLREAGRLKRVNSRKEGHWHVIK